MEDVITILKNVKAIITDTHVVYTSGKHGSVYINKDALYPHTKEAAKVGKLFAEKYQDSGVEVVVAPALGGIILSQWTAYYLSELTGREVLGVYTEKDADKNQVFTRGYGSLVKGKKVLVIEDLTTTGGSVKKVVDTVRAAGGEVIGVCTMVNRDPEHVTSETIGAPLDQLGIFKAEAWDEAECELCKKGVPVNTEIGHGKKFISKTSRP